MFGGSLLDFNWRKAYVLCDQRLFYITQHCPGTVIIPRLWIWQPQIRLVKQTGFPPIPVVKMVVWPHFQSLWLRRWVAWTVSDHLNVVFLYCVLSVCATFHDPHNESKVHVLFIWWCSYLCRCHKEATSLFLELWSLLRGRHNTHLWSL